MKLKRMLACGLAIASLLCMTTVASAVAPKTAVEISAAQAQQAAKVADAKKFAYMDVNSAPEELRSRILEARRTLVNSESWVIDGMDAVVQHNDGTEMPVPHFSDLFPGWDYAEVMNPSARVVRDEAAPMGYAAQQAAQIAEALKVAYIDLDTAPNEVWTNRILNARRTIIESEDWVADGFDAVVVHADGTETELPHFSELFPDWDLPVDEAIAKTAEDSGYADSGAQVLSQAKEVSCYLNYPDPDHFTWPFYQLVHNGSSLNTTVEQLPAGGTCNLGYTDMDTGVSFLQRSRLVTGDVMKLKTNTGIDYNFGVRASTFDVPGSAWFLVESKS